MILAGTAEGPLRILSIVLGAGSGLWYFNIGQELKGWVGPSREHPAARVDELQRRVTSLSAQSPRVEWEAEAQAIRELDTTRFRLADFDAAERAARGFVFAAYRRVKAGCVYGRRGAVVGSC